MIKRPGAIAMLGAGVSVGIRQLPDGRFEFIVERYYIDLRRAFEELDRQLFGATAPRPEICKSHEDLTVSSRSQGKAMPKMPKVGRCALCGETRPVTREHVPPKGLFLPPRPRNTITVPVCGPCNHGYHLDDEYFRTFVAALAEPKTTLWRL